MGPRHGLFWFGGVSSMGPCFEHGVKLVYFYLVYFLVSRLGAHTEGP